MSAFTSTESARLLTAPEAAESLRLGKRRLWSLSKCEALPSLKIGRSRRYNPIELDAWVALGGPTDPGAAARVRQSIRGGAQS